MNKKSGRPPIILTESQIRYAMQNSFGNKDAARFLKIDYRTYNRWAKEHIDSETGKTLYDMHTNQAGVGIIKDTIKATSGPYSIDKILTGEYPNYPTWKLRNRLLALDILKEECNCCGYAEHRVTDDTVPLLLDHMDGDETNHCIENIQLLCLNCYYQQTGNPFNKDKEQYWNYNMMD